MNAIRKLALALVLSLACALPAFAATVNINTANAMTLSQQLKGVGPSKAQAIVAWRKQHGRFKSAADLANVKGIGLKTVQRNRDVISVDGATKPAHKGASKTKH